jgi:hypothetical protein
VKFITLHLFLKPHAKSLHSHRLIVDTVWRNAARTIVFLVIREERLTISKKVKGIYSDFGLLGILSKLPQIASMSHFCAGIAYICSTSSDHNVVHRTRRAFLAGFMVTTSVLLSACTQSSPLAADTTPPEPLPALIVLQAEQKGYTEGLAAGERIQARRDRAAEAAKEKHAVPQSTESGVAASQAEATPVPPGAEPQPQPEFSYSPAGPAIPVAPVQQSGCKKSNATLCD